VKLKKAEIQWLEEDNEFIIFQLWEGLKSGVLNLLHLVDIAPTVADVADVTDALVAQAYLWYGITPP